ncbi:MAG: DegV family protein [Firmicutes bacterium]|nr:DegV family protein [Bacillota bacterium]
MKIGIVTDSTSDLPQELVSQYDIEVVPLNVLMDNQNYRDGIDLTSTEFYQKLKLSSSLPTTSQPSPGVFVEVYRTLLKKVDAILSIHLSEAFSGTVRTARIAREILPEADIRVIDSKSTSIGLGGLVVEAARCGSWYEIR